MTNTAIQPITQEIIESKIYEIRDQKVMFDSDIAKFYGVPTRRVNEAVKRNLERFPEDFMFQLTDEEWNDHAVANCDRIQNDKRNERFKPYAFTEQGVMMLASVLNSKRAIAVNIQIIRAFKKLTEAVKTAHTIKPEMEMMLALMGSMAQTVAMMQDQIMAVTDLVATLAKNYPNQPQQSEQVFTITTNQSSCSKEWVSAAEAGRLLGYTGATISRYIHMGKLVAEIIETASGHQYKVPYEAILQFKLQNQK